MFPTAFLPLILPAALLAAGDGGARPAPAAATTRAFHTAVTPRIDPVFSGPAELRGVVDKFFALHEEMQLGRDAFSNAIHETLAALVSSGARAPGTPAACPASAAERYRLAYAHGQRFLTLGRKLRELHRAIERADAMGDAVGVTPDYRFKIKRAGALFSGLLRDYREMRVAFHDQLTAELRFAGCATNLAATQGPVAHGAPAVVDPLSAEAWDGELGGEPAESARDSIIEASTRGDRRPPPATGGAAESARAIWIAVDNSRCKQSSRLQVDGVLLGEIPAARRTSVRARAGTRSLCLLPSNDQRACGDPGTLRRTYLHEGFTLTVHCARDR